MKIERTRFFGADPNPRRMSLVSGTPAFDYFPDGRVEIFVPIDGGPDGFVVTLTREEAEHLQ